MKHLFAKPYSYGFRIIAISIFVLVFGLICMSFSIRTTADDLWKQLGISQEKGSEKIKSSFMNGYLDYWGVKNIKALATGERAAVTRNLLTYAKTYLNSAAVKAAYAEERSASKPQRPELSNLTKDEIRKREVANLKRSVDESEKIIKQFPEMEKSIRASINQINSTIKEFESPNSKMIELLYQSQVEDNKYKEQRYIKDLEKWEELYPEDHRIKLRACIQKYLSVADTVDFDAELTERRGKQIFVKSEYEGKDYEWKMIFRAGKEVYQVAKPFGEQWLKELPVK